MVLQDRVGEVRGGMAAAGGAWGRRWCRAAGSGGLKDVGNAAVRVWGTGLSARGQGLWGWESDGRGVGGWLTPKGPLQKWRCTGERRHGPGSVGETGWGAHEE